MKTSESIKTIAPALLSAQKSIGSAVKDSVNPFFKSSYADLGAVMEACKNQLNENGISVLQPITSDENGVYVSTVLLHESGEWISDNLRIYPKSTTNPQDQGSAISYARRYSLQSMVFIPAEDDDGNKAVPTTKQASQAQKLTSNTPNLEERINSTFTPTTPAGEAMNQGMNTQQTTPAPKYPPCSKCGGEQVFNPKTGKIFCKDKCWLK